MRSVSSVEATSECHRKVLGELSLEVKRCVLVASLAGQVFDAELIGRYLSRMRGPIMLLGVIFARWVRVRSPNALAQRWPASPATRQPTLGSPAGVPEIGTCRRSNFIWAPQCDCAV